MAYKGKFIDRSPIICPAGLESDIDKNGLIRCLRHYPLIDQIDVLKSEAGVDKEPPPEFKRQKMQNIRHRGIYQNTRPLIRPKLETHFQTLINDLKDTTLDSFWNKQLGRGRDPTGNLPAGMDVYTTTFGTATKRDCTMKEILSPKASGIYEVLYDSQEGHEWYKKTHNDYNPAEQIDRKYCKPFSKNTRFGKKIFFDPKGVWTKCCMTWKQQEPITAVNATQADFIKRTQYDLGKCLAPNHNIDRVPKGYRFGKLSDRALHGVPELLMDFDCPPSIFKRDYYDWINHLNELRGYVKRRNLDFKNLINQCLYHDKMLTFNHRKIKPLAEYLGLLQDEFIRYHEFIDLLDVNKELPDFGKLEEMPPAGIPALRYDLPRPIVGPKCIKADMESLGDETTSMGVVNPSIYSNYGITHMDLFMPRKPALIRRLFENIDYQFPGDTFEKIWNIGVQLDKTGLVCVDTFKKLMDKAAPKHRIEEKTDVC